MNIPIDLLQRSALSCLCLFAFSLLGGQHSLASDRDLSLTAAGNKIIHELLQGDYVAFDREVSSYGLLIVRREPDWQRSHILLKDKPARFWPQGHTHSLSFSNMKTVVWTEYEIPFAKPELRDANYLSLLKQFRGLMLESQSNYHHFIISPETADGFWFSERRLGPTIFGKIASDECLYIYLKRENGKWKAWRIECWLRGAP